MLKKIHIMSSASLLALAMAVTPALAETTTATTVTTPVTVAPTVTTPVANLVNNSYVTLSGVVGEVTEGDEFELRYGGGTVMVDTNDTWPDLFKKDASMFIKTGDRITVTGRVDANFFDKKEIEAYRLTVHNDNYYRTYTNNDYAPSYQPDTQYYYYPYDADNSLDDKTVSMTGQVSAVGGNDDFMLRYGDREIKVDTDKLNFTDASRLTVGDIVTVYGNLDKDWFNKTEVEATKIVRTRVYTPVVVAQ